MSIFQEKQVIDQECEDGIWLDYQNNTWIFYIKDEVWQPEEIQHTKSGEIEITFIQRGISDAFILKIMDCLEESDLPFCVKEASEDLLQELHSTKDYGYEIVLINKDNVVCAVRNGMFKHRYSEELKQKLIARVDENFTIEDAENSYVKLSQKFQPYELEEFAVFTQKN